MVCLTLAPSRNSRLATAAHEAFATAIVVFRRGGIGNEQMNTVFLFFTPQCGERHAVDRLPTQKSPVAVASGKGKEAQELMSSLHFASSFAFVELSVTPRARIRVGYSSRLN